MQLNALMPSQTAGALWLAKEAERAERGFGDI
jgi:hypothetical protein